MKRIILHVVMDDGTEYNPLVVNNQALVAWDFERAAKRWPGPTDAPMLWQTFLAWAQLVHQGDYPRHPEGNAKQTTFQRFREVDCVAIDQLKGTEDEDVDPTRAEPASASPSPQ